mgnify:CR=1 FL=1
MAGLRIDQLTLRTPIKTDVTATTASGGPAGQSTMITVVEAGCSGVTVLNIGATGAGASLAFPSSSTTISANTNNLALSTSAFQRIDCTANSNLTGIAPPSGLSHVDGRMIRLVNIGAHKLTCVHQSASSTNGNKFYFHQAQNIDLDTNHWLELVYDATDGYWRGWHAY